MKKVLVLGCGMVGKVMALDLAERHEVTVADNSEEVLKRVPELNTLVLDVRKKDLLMLAVREFDLVVCAVPGFLGYETLKSVILAGVDVVDISFFPEDALTLNELAIEKGVIAFVDMGVAPGLSNLILGHHNNNMKIDSFECLVGGLPKVLNTYKAPFSPVDVIQEYLRPARLFENGKVVVKRALSEPEYINAKGSLLEAFNTDGLRSLLRTMSHIPNMKEKTLRYPGHRNDMQFLNDTGFFDNENFEFTSKVLTDNWKLKPEDDEFTYMRVTVEGEEKKHVWELYDETDSVRRISSMSRTTGYTCCALVEILLSNQWAKPGIFPGELLGGEQRVFNHVISFLRLRGVNIIAQC